MVKRWRELFNFINDKRPGYVLLTGIVLLMLICLTVVWQYHYYTQQWITEEQLTRQFLREAAHNLAIQK